MRARRSGQHASLLVDHTSPAGPQVRRAAIRPIDTRTPYTVSSSLPIALCRPLKMRLIGPTCSADASSPLRSRDFSESDLLLHGRESQPHIVGVFVRVCELRANLTRNNSRDM